jgi:1-acyl-sn-glycerol-3-phosphate acyltransferase
MLRNPASGQRLRQAKEAWMGYDTRDRVVNRSLFHRMIAGPVFWFTLFIVVIYDWTVFRLRVEGRENLRRLRGRGAFIISNHTLYFDPAVIAHALAPRRTRFSALQATFSIPFVGNFIRYLGAFPIPARDGLLKLVQPIREMLDKGWLVHFFPEGDLSPRSQDPAEFSNGVFFFSHLFDRPVLPMTIVLLPMTILGVRLSRRFFRVKVVIGRELNPARYRSHGLGRREAIQAMARDAREAMSSCIRRERAPYFDRPAGAAGFSTSRSGPDESRAERSQKVG